jgi:hypothetical protein
MAGQVGEMVTITVYSALAPFGDDDHLACSDRMPASFDLDASRAFDSDEHHVDLGVDVAVDAMASHA